MTNTNKKTLDFDQALADGYHEINLNYCEIIANLINNNCLLINKYTKAHIDLV
jgi:hypothetical protein